MKAFVTRILLNDLKDDVAKLLAETKELLLEADDYSLSKSPAEGKWSAIQCLEHLNSYNRYYLPQIEKVLLHGTYKNVVAQATYKPGWLGNYFTKMMKPEANGELASKMRAPKDHRPNIDLNVRKVLAEFIEGEEKLLSYLERAEKLNIARLRIPISIAKFIKLKLGDTFRFLIAHRQRHMLQAIKAYNAVKKESAVYI
jgi:hypothetical protein